MANPRWLEWAQRLQAIAQTGLHFSQDVFDRERYEQIRQIAAEIAAANTGADAEQINGLFQHDEGYATPKVDVRGVVFDQERILLVKEVSDGLWTLPGGWADIGDTPAQATVREIREESGYETRAVKLLAVYDRQKQGHPPYAFWTYKLFFQCELTGGAARTSVETSEVGFFTPDELPPLSTGRVTPQQIARFYEHLHNPALPTDFD